MKNDGVLVLYNEDYPWDVRIDKMTIRMLRGGRFSTYILCKDKDGNGHIKNFNGTKIYRVPKYSTIPQEMLSPFLWILAAFRIINNNNVKIIIIRDLPYSLVGILVGKLLKCRIILDMAENYPAATRIWKKTGEYTGRLSNLVHNVFLLKVIEIVTCYFSDLIIVVSKENNDRLVNKKVGQDKIVIIENTPIIVDYSSKAISQKKSRETIRAFKLLYIGGLQFHRGLHDVIYAVDKIKAKIPQIKFIIVGEGKQKSNYESIVNKLSLNHHIEFLGYVEHSKIFSLIDDVDVCLVPHIKSEHTDTTIPNKIYDYMMMSKPILVSNANPLVRIVNTYKCGMVYRSGDLEDLSVKILNLFNLEYDKLNEFGIRGRMAVVSKHNWNFDGDKFMDSIQ